MSLVLIRVWFHAHLPISRVWIILKKINRCKIPKSAANYQLIEAAKFTAVPTATKYQAAMVKVKHKPP